MLTRLPPPHRFAPGTARDLLRASFADETLTLDRAAHAALLDRLVEAGISGGASYDALIGVTASQHSATLFTRDPRAIKVYAALGVDFGAGGLTATG